MILLGKRYLLPIILIVCAFIAGHSLQTILNPPQASQQISNPVPISNLIGTYRPDFELPDLQNQMHSIQEWDGYTRIINFWATWCPPCRKEIPAFVAAQTQYANHNLQILGIAIDQPENVMKFATERHINYPMLYGQQDASEIGKIYGNQIGALPYTIFIDANGIIRHIHNQGELTFDAIKNILENL